MKEISIRFRRIIGPLLILICVYSFNSSAQITINGVGSYATINAAIGAAAAGDIIEVPPGIYSENVLINKQNLTLRSTGGKAVTTIMGTFAGGNGSVSVASGINGVTIGQPGKGFKIIGFDGNGAVETAAVYLLGAHTNITIQDNEIMAAGEYGLLSDFNTAIDGIYIKNNMFTGQTFLGPTPGGCGFGTQFDVGNNVPRQLVTLSGGAGVTNSRNVFFINNMVTGTAGGFNTEPACSVTGQGNTLVTIDVIGCTIAGNTFNGVTTRFSNSLRTRGPAASIYCNTFYTTGLGAFCGNVFFGTAAPLTGASPGTLAGVAASNSFLNGGAYLTPNHPSSYAIYLDLAQAVTAATSIGAGQSAVAAATSFTCPVLNVNTGLTYFTIQAAIDAPETLAGHTISVSAGTYNEDVLINKSLTIIGAGYTSTTVSGPIGGPGSTMHVSAPGVLIDGFTITRAGNNPGEWNLALNSAGVSVQSQGNYAEIRNCKFIGNRTGIDINNSNGNNIHNNIIDNNRTGLIFRNQTDNTNMQENFITNSWTMGVLFLDASGGTNVPVQTAANSTFNNNHFSGNWYASVEDRQSGGAVPAPGTNLKNFTCNWYGTLTPVVSAVSGGEPGYAAQIPVIFGGTAVPPGGQPDIKGSASANFSYVTWLVSGVDNAPGTVGFQPAPNSCAGCPSGNIVQNTNTGQFYCSIQSAINDVLTLSGHTISVGAGTYNENVTVNKSVTLRGANADIACGSRGAESVVSVSNASPAFTVTASGVTINGFEIIAPASTYAINGSNTSNLSVVFNNIHDIGTTVAGANVHAFLYMVSNSPAATSNVTVSDNCFNNISSVNNFNVSNVGFSSSAIGILQSISTGTLTTLNIERNRISNVILSTEIWPKGKIAYGIQLNTGSAGYMTTTGKIVNAVIRNNEISNLSSHISTGIALEGNTENAVVENNIVSSLNGTKTDVRAGGGYDLNGLKFESNRFVSTVTVKNNSFQTNTFTHSAGGKGYGVVNYVPVANGGTATVECNWFGTNVYSAIVDNGVSIDGKILNKVGCATNFVPYLISGTDASAAIGFQPLVPCATCSGMSVSLGNNRFVFYGVSGYPGASGILTPTISGAAGPYTYLWSSANVSVNGSTAASVTPTGYTDGQSVSYNVTVTAGNGCTATATVTITYININCSNNANNIKIKVCHRPQGNTNNCQSICVSINAVQAMLDNGSYLGSCLPGCAVPPQSLSGQLNIMDYVYKDGPLQVKVYNNPTSSQFRLLVNGDLYGKISIRILDYNGRQVEQRTNLPADKEIVLGQGYSSGIYIAEIKQGENQVILKLIKTN